jgi:AGZA family xanthine/uracil permease-like MFS transporter
MTSRYRWAQKGDINAFFGLVLDNVAVLILMVSLLHETFGFPERFALRHMITGTALGVLVGDLLFFFLALRLARTSGSTTVTAMPLGIDTPSTFGMALFVLGPAFLDGQQRGMDVDAAAYFAWQIGICSMFISGIFKLVCALGSGWVRRVVPRAGLLGSLAAIALVLISFFPLLDVLRVPLVGLVSLAIILTSLVGRVPLPFKLPGTVGAFLVAGSLYGLMMATGHIAASGGGQFNAADGLLPTEWLAAFQFGWLARMQDTLNYLPLIIPFALATVVGGIDCTESAIAAGDHYDTRSVIGIEAIATLAASFCGAVIQTTPYIGHPAYKAMGGRAAYTLATALFMGAMGLIGLFGYFYQFIPAVAVYPILVFVGVEITAQSFLATPRRHYTAVAIACVPALAALAMNFIDQIWFDPQILDQGHNPAFAAKSELVSKVGTAALLSRGFILTSIFWASALAMAIDRQLVKSAWYYLAAAVCTLFGLMHSPLPNAPLRLPFAVPGLPDSLAPFVLPKELQSTTLQWAGGYFLVALGLLLWAWYLKSTGQTEPDGHVDTAA